MNRASYSSQKGYEPEATLLELSSAMLHYTLIPVIFKAAVYH